HPSRLTRTLVFQRESLAAAPVSGLAVARSPPAQACQRRGGRGGCTGIGEGRAAATFSHLLGAERSGWALSMNVAGECHLAVLSLDEGLPGDIRGDVFQRLVETLKHRLFQRRGPIIGAIEGGVCNVRGRRGR